MMNFFCVMQQFNIELISFFNVRQFFAFWHFSWQICHISHICGVYTLFSPLLPSAVCREEEKKDVMKLKISLNFLLNGGWMELEEENRSEHEQG